MLLDFDVRDWIGVKGWTFSLEEVLLLIMDSYFDQKWWFKVKNLSMMDLFITNLFVSKTFIYESCGLLVDYRDVFISCLDSHSDGTHSLQRVLCWASNVKWYICAFVQVIHLVQIYISPSTSWKARGWVHFSKCSFLAEPLLLNDNVLIEYTWTHLPWSIITVSTYAFCFPSALCINVKLPAHGEKRLTPWKC